ncbi:MAG: rod shape-determining protein RodA [Magnetococcales bacterium]|nr:rod shape-determining protein RodA [Magnetococcales bacterium]
MVKGGAESALTSDDALALGLRDRLERFPWSLLVLLGSIAAIGLMVLYSAVGESNVDMMVRQSLRFAVVLVTMMVLALANEKVYRRYAYLVYAVILLLLIVVAITGHVGMGARRWIDLGVFHLQPSELMKVGCVMALARYFHDRGVSAQLQPVDMWVSTGLLLVPLALIIDQPDLGTGVLVAVTGSGVIFVAGLSWRALVIALLGAAGSIPLAWNWLHEYQRKRVITLFNPEEDPLGAGYHIIQSKIAVGSGGLTGKGFMEGSQSYLDFLPERHTDFIFSVLAEEWGFIGAMILIALYGLIVVRGLMIASMARDRFGLLLAVGVVTMFLFQVVINIGMVIGLLPVVGLPLPLVSYGGSSLTTMMLSMGLLAHVSIHSKQHGRAV